MSATVTSVFDWANFKLQVPNIDDDPEFDDDEKKRAKEAATISFGETIAIILNTDLNLLNFIDWCMLKFVSKWCYQMIDLHRLFVTLNKHPYLMVWPDNLTTRSVMLLCLCTDIEETAWNFKPPSVYQILYMVNLVVPPSKLVKPPRPRMIYENTVFYSVFKNLIYLVLWCTNKRALLNALYNLGVGIDASNICYLLTACAPEIKSVDYVMLRFEYEDPIAAQQFYKNSLGNNCVVSLIAYPSVLRHLCQRWHLNLACFPSIKYKAAERGYHEALKIYHDYVPTPFTMDLLRTVFNNVRQFADDECYVETMDFVIDNLNEQCRRGISRNPRVMVWAAMTGRIGLIQALERRGLECSTCALVAAVDCRHLDAMNYIYGQLRKNHITTPTRIWCDLISRGYADISDQVLFCRICEMASAEAPADRRLFIELIDGLPRQQNEQLAPPK